MFYSIFYSFSSIWNIIFFVVIFILFKRISSLNDRLNKLEGKNTHIQEPVTSTTSVVNQNLKTPVTESNNTINISVSNAKIIETDNEITNWFKENLLLKVGMLMILAGFGWFVSYAFAHNWIGPIGRITLGIITGTLVTMLGTYRLKISQLQGRSLTILGSALTIISIIAGQYYYHFFSSSIVLILVFIISLYVTLTSAGYDDEELAVYGILVSLLAPYFSHSLEMDKLMLFSYLAVASASIIWVTVFKGWKKVIIIGFTGIVIYSVFITGVGKYEYKYMLLLVGYGISLIYLIVNVWSMIKNMLQTQKEDLYLAAINSVFILIFTNSIVPKVYQSLTLAVWMLIFALSGFFVFIRTRTEKLFYVHSCVAVLFLGVATSIELSGPTLVIAFAIESALLILSSYIVTNNSKASEYASITFILPIILSRSSLYSNAWKIGILHSDFVVLFLICLLLLVLGIFFKLNDKNSSNALYKTAFIASSLYAYALVWLSSHSLINNDDTAVFFSLFIYTVVGLFTYFYGLFNQNSTIRKYGMAVLIAVVIRLVLVDVWNMDLVLRVITFIVLGVMFMSSALISKKQYFQK